MARKLCRSATATTECAATLSASVLAATTLVRVGNASGPRVYRKRGRWFTPSGHTHPLERSIEPAGAQGRTSARDENESSLPLGALLGRRTGPTGCADCSPLAFRPTASPALQVSCEEKPRQMRSGTVEVSDLVIAAIPVGDPRPGKGGGRSGVERSCPATFLSQVHPNAGRAYPAS